jgi:hypothetical protein
MVGIGVGWGSRRSGEEEAGGLGRRQHNPRMNWHGIEYHWQ